MVVPAPPRFSTTMGCPNCDDKGSNTVRGTTSVALPAPHRMIAWIGLLGQVWASASPQPPSRTINSASNQHGISASPDLCIVWITAKKHSTPNIPHGGRVQKCHSSGISSPRCCEDDELRLASSRITDRQARDRRCTRKPLGDLPRPLGVFLWR